MLDFKEGTVMDAFASLADVARTTSNASVERWKRGGRKVIGFFCSYVPEELIHAAGMLPYRIKARGCLETPLADSLMAPVNCSFARSCLQKALQGDYAFLDGVVSVNSCDHIRRMYDVWRYRVPIPYYHFLSVPRKVSEEAVHWFRDELAQFKESLEAGGNRITDQSLRASIRTYNETRRLMRQVFDLRSAGAPPLTGSEACEIALAATSMPKEEYNRIVVEALREASTRQGPVAPSARLMIVGSALDDPSLVAEVESLGGLVVADALCFSSRYFWEPVREDGDALEALARSYLNRPACPRMATEHASRVRYILDMVDRFGVDGIVLERIRYCDLWGGESMVLRRDLEDAGVPVLVIDREYLLSGVGQVRTRVQAFLEMLGN